MVVEETHVNHIQEDAHSGNQRRHPVPSEGVVLPDELEVAAQGRGDDRETDTADEHKDDDHNKHIARMPVVQADVLGGISACRGRRHRVAYRVKPVHRSNKEQDGEQSRQSDVNQPQVLGGLAYSRAQAFVGDARHL